MKHGLTSKAARHIKPIEDDVSAVVANVQGLEKTGKNHFCATAPSPQLVISGDRKLDRLLKKFPKQDIEVARFGYDLFNIKKDEEIKSIVKPVWKDIVELFFDALHSKLRTIVMDNGTWIWETCRLAHFGRAERVPPLFYGPVNAAFERMLLAGEESGKNVLWIHRMADKWADKRDPRTGQIRSINTGQIERKGFKNVGFDVQTNLQTIRVDDRFSVKVIDTDTNPEWNGYTFKGKCDFPTVMSTIYGNDPEDWQ